MTLGTLLNSGILGRSVPSKPESPAKKNKIPLPGGPCQDRRQPGFRV